MKGELQLHKQLSIVWYETHSVDTARGALDRPLWHLMIRRIFHGDSQGILKHIHVALIATWRVSLITSFQPPLLHDYINMLCDDITPWPHAL